MAAARTTGPRIVCSMPFASTCPDGGRGGALARAAAVILLAAAAVWPSGTRAQSQSAVFRSQAELVVLQVVVADEHGRFVPDLDMADFTVHEDGVPQKVTLFAADE